jgi:hypothetical protein
VEQIEAGVWTRLLVGSPERTCRLKLVFGDIDNGRLQLLELSRTKTDQLEVHEAKLQPGDSLGIRAKMIEQPSQLQLRVRTRIEP